MDANYNFIFANVGCQGRISDGGVFKKCFLWKLIEGKKLNIPKPQPLLSRARRIVVNAYGILSAVFRVLRKPIILDPEKATLVVLSTIHLHNFLKNSTTSNRLCTSPDFPNNVQLEQTETSSFLNIRNIPRKSINVQEIRRELAEYFIGNGRVQWQDDYA